jgi:hypothetical protein
MDFSNEKTVTINILAKNPLLVGIDELGFIGCLSYSPSLTYAIAYSDSYRTADGNLRGGGFRDSGRGTVALLKGSQLLWRCEIPRPTQAAASDDGIVLVCDIGFGTDTKTDVLLFDRNGNKVMQEKIKAFALSCAITPDGSMALVNSACSNESDHSCKLLAVSIPELRRLFSVDFPLSQIKSAVRDNERIAVQTDDLLYKFSLAGERLNGLEIDGQLFDKEMNSGHYAAAYYFLDRRANGPLPERERAFLLHCFTRLAACASPEYSAKSYKYLGELALATGDATRAGEFFHAALELDPKIGLKRRLRALEKDIKKSG